jgi:hypothetical protein
MQPVFNEPDMERGDVVVYNKRQREQDEIQVCAAGFPRSSFRAGAVLIKEGERE